MFEGTEVACGWRVQFEAVVVDSTTNSTPKLNRVKEGIVSSRWSACRANFLICVPRYLCRVSESIDGVFDIGPKIKGPAPHEWLLLHWQRYFRCPPFYLKSSSTDGVLHITLLLAPGS